MQVRIERKSRTMKWREKQRDGRVRNFSEMRKQRENMENGENRVRIGGRIQSEKVEAKIVRR